MANTYFIDALLGNDLNSGTSPGATGAWATIDKAMNNVLAGDKVWVKGSADYNETATIDTVGSGNAPIVFEGYTSVTGDGGRATINGQNTRVACINDSLGNVDGFYVFKNFRFTDGTTACFATSVGLMTFKNCKFDDANSTAWVDVNGGYVFEDCEFANNNDSGLFASSRLLCLGCKFTNNTFEDLHGSNFFAAFCTFFSNGDAGVSSRSSSEFGFVFNSTFDGDSKDTVTASEFTGVGSMQNSIVNCIFYDNATGIRSVIGERLISRNNLFGSNTAKYAGTAGTFTSEISGAPAFNNEAGLDYRLQGTSSGIKNGFDGGIVNGFSTGMDIGAFQVLGTGIVLSSHNNINLYEHGKSSISGSNNLFTKGIGLITDNIHLFVKASGTPSSGLGSGDDQFCLTLEQFIKNGDFNPQIIGRFTSDPSSVTIEVWNVIDGRNNAVTLDSDVCYQIGDTGRWAWSTINLLSSGIGGIINQFVYEMGADTGETFTGEFILNTRRINSYKIPRNNDHILRI